jgi:hypothetical protein
MVTGKVIPRGDRATVNQGDGDRNTEFSQLIANFNLSQ